MFCLPDHLPALHSSSLYPRVTPFHICTIQHLPVMNFVPILLPTAPYQPRFLQFLTLALHFPLLSSSASVAGSAMSPLYPIFQIMVFTAGPWGLSGQLSILYLARSPWPHSTAEGPNLTCPFIFFPTAAGVFKHSVQKSPVP